MLAGKKIFQRWRWVIVTLAVTVSFAGEITKMPKASSQPKSGGVILIRHGEGEHNVEQRFNSRPDHPNYAVKHLTALGQSQARTAGEELQKLGISDENICRVLVSPLPRTQETAGLIMDEMLIAHTKKQAVDALIETDAGEREGRLHEEFHDRDEWFPDDPKSFGGETTGEVASRTRRVLTDILNDPDCDLQNNYVLLVSHGVPIYVMLDLLTGNPEKISPASFRIIHNPGLKD